MNQKYEQLQNSVENFQSNTIQDKNILGILREDQKSWLKVLEQIHHNEDQGTSLKKIFINFRKGSIKSIHHKI